MKSKIPYEEDKQQPHTVPKTSKGTGRQAKPVEQMAEL
jgi:hypothetical protein